MSFKELQELFESKLGITTLADIARELNVTPQVVSNWKSKDQIPYKYVIKIRSILSNKKNENLSFNSNTNKYNEIVKKDYNNIELITISIRSIIITIIKDIKIISTFVISASLLMLANLTFNTRDIYTSSASILPLMGGGSLKSSIAGSLGIGSFLDEGGNFPSPDIIPNVIKSKLLLERLLEKKYYIDGDTLRHIDILSENKENSINYTHQEIQVATHKLRKSISVNAPRNTRVINILARANDPNLAAELAKNIVIELEKIFVFHKMEKNKEQRLFFEQRMKEINKELIDAEEDLRLFSEKNRLINNSPALILEKSRLERVVRGKMQVLVNLKSDYEVVKIQEHEEKNSLLVLDKPAVPFVRSSPQKTKIMLSTIFGSFIISFLIVSIKNWFIENYALYIAPLLKNM